MSAVRGVLWGALALLLALPAVHAQSGGPRPQAGTAAQGSAGSGANRGGAGGLANPDPGGGPAESAGPLGGPDATASRRAGYLGGRAAPEGGGGGSVAPSAPRSAFSCHDANPSAMSPSARVSGPNAERIEDARLTVRPMRGRLRGESARLLLANFQEELAKPAPDLELAGTYLGMAAGEPVTPEVALRVSEILCVPLAREHASRVSAVAEGQRLRLEAGGR